jgi:hypothetical protein
MKLKEHKKVSIGEYIKLFPYRGSFGYFDTPSNEGIITKIKGLNGDCYELTFDNGSVGYLTWTCKIERGN